VWIVTPTAPPDDPNHSAHPVAHHDGLLLA
jgi:hypothetical protein